MIDLSIIIVSYNNKELLNDCLLSIFKTFPSQEKLEVIVVDNNSADNTIEFLQTNFSQIQVIANDYNAGFAKANNQGIRIALGDKILLLNNDTVVQGKALNELINTLDSNHEIGLIGPKLLNIDKTIQAQGSALGKPFWKSTIPVEVKFLTGAAIMTTRATINKVGLLDEGFFFYNEDIDYCWRIRAAGFKLVYLPSAEIIHYGGNTSLKKQLMGLKGSLYLWWKYSFGRLINLRKDKI